MILILHCCNGKLIFDMNWNHLIEDDFNQIIHDPSFKFSSISSLLGDLVDHQLMHFSAAK